MKHDVAPGQAVWSLDEIGLRPYQERVIKSRARDVVVISAPQLGKTELARIWLLYRAINHGPDNRPWWWTAPTYAQAKHGFNGIVRYAQQLGICESFTTSTPLVLRLTFGAVIEGRSWDSAPGLYGPTVLGGVADEFGWMTAVAYSALSSRRAETVTEGLGHFLWIGNVGNIGSEAQRLWDLADADSEGFDSFRWTWHDRAAAHVCSCGNGTATPCDIEHADEHSTHCRRGVYLRFIRSEQGRMSRAQFAQLYDAEWADFNDTPVYTFDRTVHVRAERAEFDPELPIELSCDFNVDPMAWTLGQHRGNDCWTFDEIIIPGGATTMQACDEFLRKHPDPRIDVVVYGDRSGKSRDTRSKTTDYNQIREILGTHYYNFRMDVPDHNPPVMARVNAVNAKLRAADASVSMWIHPRCKTLINDRARVSWKPGTRDIHKPTSGEGAKLTHASDADDYRWIRLFPVQVESPVYVGVPDTTPFVDPFIGQAF